MQFDNFERIVTTFADEDGGVVIENGKLLMSIRGRDVEADIQEDGDGIRVVHDDSDWRAEEWVRSNLARLDIMADRIIKYVNPPDHYVSPSGKLLDWENNFSDEDTFSDSTQELRQRLAIRAAGTTSVYFLTSNAGEGKTSLIEKISVDQAKEFKKKKTKTLILPIPLGGRSFLRFDDAVIALLSNLLRFQFLYYDSFLELVKMGAIIPAFDGYEEMLSESESGEAVTAVTQLIEQLSSTGTLLVAARKAYFDSSLRFESRFVDSVRSEHKVEIHHFTLDRWNRKVFMEYAHKRNISAADQLYDQVKTRLDKDDHPVLTRAVLVRRLLDVAEEENDDQMDAFLERLYKSQANYFYDFVEKIVDREKQKWINRSGTDHSPLLSSEEHHELLSLIAAEMWINSVDTLKFDLVRLVVELFVDENNKRPSVARQICNRINDHALLRLDSPSGAQRSGHLRFDHEDFQDFYLGQALARTLMKDDSSTARLILDAHSIAPPVIKESARFLKDSHTQPEAIDRLLNDLKDLLIGKWHISYIYENCSALMLELCNDLNKPFQMKGLNFPSNSLQKRKLKDLTVSNSFFNVTSIGESEFKNCMFDECRFAELSIDGLKNLDNTIFKNCTFDSVVIGTDSEEGPRAFFDHYKIFSILRSRGFQIHSTSQEDAHSSENGLVDMDNDMKLMMRFIRMYNRATTIPESEIRKRIGKQSGHFFKNILPKLEKVRFIHAVEKSSKKFRLLISISDIYRLIEKSDSTFHQFIEEADSLAIGRT